MGEVVERFDVPTVTVSQGNELAQVQPGARLEGSGLAYITITDAAVVSGYGSRREVFKAYDIARKEVRRFMCF